MLLTEGGRREKRGLGKEGEISDQEGEESSSFSLELSRGRRGEILPPICTGRTCERQVENRLLCVLNRVIKTLVVSIGSLSNSLGIGILKIQTMMPCG